MTTTTRPGTGRDQESFRHEALFYAGLDDFVRQTSAFIRDAVRASEPILVVVSATKIDALRSELGPEERHVRFADMNDVGLNPARIIPAWREFVDEQAGSGRRFRGIGEPIWAERSADQLVECERHEALLNLAFDGSPPWWLVCPYDTEGLGAAVLEEAERNHPFLAAEREHLESHRYRGLEEVARPFDLPLPEPPPAVRKLVFRKEDLRTVRTTIARLGADHGLSPERVNDFVLAVDEVATNSLRHGGGEGSLRSWSDGPTLICEVSDHGRIDAPMVGRERPSPTSEGGFGLWLANQLCDLVQVRTFPDGSIVRLHIS